MGDGLLAEFPSVVEAVRCAAEIQHTMSFQRDRDFDPTPDIFAGMEISFGN